MRDGDCGGGSDGPASDGGTLGSSGEGGGGNDGGGMDGTGASGIVQVVRLRSTMWPAPSPGNACSLPERDLAIKTHAAQAKGIKTRQPIAAGARQLDCHLAARVAVLLLLVVAASPSESSS